MQSLENLLPTTQRSQTATPQRMLGRRAASDCTVLRMQRRANQLSAQKLSHTLLWQTFYTHLGSC